MVAYRNFTRTADVCAVVRLIDWMGRYDYGFCWGFRQIVAGIEPGMHDHRSGAGSLVTLDRTRAGAIRVGNLGSGLAGKTVAKSPGMVERAVADA